MTLIAKPYTFTAGQTIVASEQNSNFDTIYSDYNGNITNVNISGSANIADTKLAQITSPSKVSGAALTLLGSTPSGAGDLPLANIEVGTAYQVLKMVAGVPAWGNNSIFIGSTTRTLSTASGTQAITGVGFSPTLVIFLTARTDQSSGQGSIGVDNNSTAGCYWNRHGVQANSDFVDTTYSIYSAEDGSNYNRAKLSSLDSDGVTLTWTKTGSPTGTQTIVYCCMK